MGEPKGYDVILTMTNELDKYPLYGGPREQYLEEFCIFASYSE